MNFTKISVNAECDCLTSAEENTADSFVRKVRRSEVLNNADFRNHIERNKMPQDPTNCEEVCGLYGVSMEIWNEVSSKPLLDKYLVTAKISPKLKNNLCVIKFTVDCGLIKYSPGQPIYNEFHYDFYKEDDFIVEKLHLVEMIQLKAE